MNFESAFLSLLLFLVRLDILEDQRFKLDVSPITPIYWVSDTEVFVNEKDRSFIYDIETRSVKEEAQRATNQIHGYVNGQLLICEWENVEIDSPEEFSTHLTQKKKGGDIILDVQLRPTLSVIECRDDIILKTVPPIKERMYEFKGDLYEVESYYQDMFSSNLKILLSKDGLGNYWVTKFFLKDY